MKVIEVNGHTELINKLNELSKEEYLKDQPIFICFVGSKLATTGKSWCSDCVNAEPAIDETLLELKELDNIFVICYVGDKDEWTNPANTLKNDVKFGVKCVPTLIAYSVKDSKFIGGKILDKDEDFIDSGNIVSFIVSLT